MRILAVTPLYPPRSLVGAWIATHQLNAWLVAAGHDVTVHAFLASSRGWEVDGVRVTTPGDRLEPLELARNADVVVGHCGDVGTAGRIAHAADRPLVQLYHGGHRVPDPDARLVVFNSHASAAGVPWAGPSLVCRPWTDPAQHATTPGDRVTLVNCSRDKGVMTAWRAALALPHLAFLGVRGGHGQQIIPRAANFEVVHPVTDMRAVWSRTRVLLMPSHREAWGMVGVEALASGIPVIASDLPGPRESLGDAAVFLPPHDHLAWTAEIERLQDPDEWATASAKALERSGQLAADDPRPRFAEALETLAGVPA